MDSELNSASFRYFQNIWISHKFSNISIQINNIKILNTPKDAELNSAEITHLPNFDISQTHEDISENVQFW